jgi:membrane-associated phospholipid phosphatase
MAVFTALMVAISRYFPQYRSVCYGFLFLTGMALIVTEYHFFGDVVAGVYLGLVVDRVTHKILTVSCRTGLSDV